jgi:hypothetical protein
MAVAEELPELAVSSKTQSAEKIAEVMSSLGYNVSSVEQEATQQTPEEIQEAAETARVEQETKDQQAREDAANAEETERKSRNQRRKEARERDQEALRQATEANSQLKREVEELRKAQTSTTSQLEELRKNPPRAVVEPPLPEAPKRPTKAEFFESDDPDQAYEDALFDWRDKKVEHDKAVAERAKPKVVEEKAAPVVPAAAEPPKTADAATKLFLGSVEALEKRLPDDKKSGLRQKLAENLPNTTEPMRAMLLTMEDPARIAQYLAEHPEESKRIKGLTEGLISDNPKLVKIATRELDKIEQLAADEDTAAAGADPGSADDKADEAEPDPEVDASAARISSQPQRPAQQQRPPAAAAAAPTTTQKPPTKKATPIDPVGARGVESAKRYEDMTPAEQRALSVDDVRKMRGML